MNTRSIIVGVAVVLCSVGSALVYAQPTSTGQAAAPVAVEVGNKICPVSGDKIPAPGEKGDMGDNPVKIEYKGKIYNLCCPMCVKDFGAMLFLVEICRILPKTFVINALYQTISNRCSLNHVCFF